MSPSRLHPLVAIGLLCALSVVVTGATTRQAPRRMEYEPRPSIPIRVIDILPGLEDVVKLETALGAYVTEGMKPPPQPSVGLPPDVIRRSDFIVGIDDQPVRSSEDLSRIVAAKTPGDEIAVTVIRDGKQRILRIVVERSLPAIYLPAATCPLPTEVLALETSIWLFSGAPMVGMASPSPDRVCRFVAEACTPLQLEKQTETRTLVQLNMVTHEILGDWRAHTHLDRAECLREKASLETSQIGHHP